MFNTVSLICNNKDNKNYAYEKENVSGKQFLSFSFLRQYSPYLSLVLLCIQVS
jgi:hypothetical protein